MAEHVDTGNADLDKAIKQWLEWDKNMATRQEVTELLNDHNVAELQERFGTRIQFGTAGLRAAMEAGTARINDLIIIQTAQGLLRYLESVNPECKSQGIIIGYDARYSSQRYAHLTAAIMLRAGIPVYLFSDIVPTPFVPYAIRKYGCAVGVMVTPSHNPKGDNGYKVYWNNSAQIISPIDKGIAKNIEENLEPWSDSWDTSILTRSKLLTDPSDDVLDSYIQDLQQKCLHREINEKTPLKFTYSAMHGVGTKFICAATQSFGFQPLIMVKEQVEPDPEFPTVKYPNPEEGKSALDLSMSTAEANGSSIIIANDPDADRLAVAEKQRDGQWKIFTGNELGALLGWWCYSCAKQQNGVESTDSDMYMLASTVSSKLLQKMAEYEGFHFVETLTGFKWMGNKAVDLIKEGKNVIFAFEEAIGFMCGTMVMDKDGISAGTLACEMAAYLKSINLTCTEKLEEIYTKYGYHVSKNSYYICLQPATIKAMFDRIRTLHQGSYPDSIGNSKVTSVRDLTTGYDSSQPDKQAILPVSKSSQMITFTFDNGVTATLRTSGTEPKVKYYTEICADVKQRSKEEISDELSKFVDILVEELLQPELNKLIPKGD
ncbi:phosphoglucomutase-2-like [Lytechinus variegatus]|uniref:phosphoglucomutase-2-like n=1 Tax=Lytechinus variegatus TaxID=7654 RepID=UPI001BB13CFD|nr:phosphoglucomutase-2-like [Lytechinus variegatus]